MIKIIFIKLNLDRNWKFVPSIDLCPARETRGKSVYTPFGKVC